MVDLQEHLKKASKAQHEKYKKEDYSEWGKRSAQSRFSHMTKEEKSEYFRKVRAGKSVKSS